MGSSGGGSGILRSKSKGNHNNASSIVPKGCLAIKVGQSTEEQQRFVVPVMYFNHPLFLELLKGAEEEYGFEHKGAITIPCHVEEFIQVQRIIDGDKYIHHHSNNNNNNNIVGCFRV